MTHVIRDPISHNRSYRRALQAQANGLPSRGSESDMSNTLVAQVPLGGRPPRGPSHLGSGD